MKKAKVYLEHVNYRGEVTDKALIATMRNIIWAEEFVDKCCTDGDGYRFTIEEV